MQTDPKNQRRIQRHRPYRQYFLTQPSRCLQDKYCISFDPDCMLVSKDPVGMSVTVLFLRHLLVSNNDREDRRCNATFRVKNNFRLSMESKCLTYMIEVISML